MEIAGLAIALFDETFKIVSFLHQALSDERHFGADANVLRIRMDDEQLRLRALRQLLFSKSPIIKNPKGRLFDEFDMDWQFTVLEMLRQLRKQLAEYIPLQIEYKLMRPREIVDPSSATLETLSHEFDKKKNEEFEMEIQKSTSPFLKWKFALWDKKKAEKLIDEFTNWNNRVQRNLELVLLRVRVLGNSQELETFQKDANAISLGLSRNARLRQILKDMKTIPNMEFNKDVIIPSYPKIEHLDQGVWQGKSIRTLVEYQKYMPVDGKASKIDIESINQLVVLLSEANRTEFLTFPCGGFFINNASNEFGICFDIPRHIDVLSAFSLLKAYKKTQPSLSDRFKLSHALALGLSAFHVVGWLHKSLRSEVILFFDDHGAIKPELPSITRPFIFGFEYSRPAAKITSGFYDDIIERNIYRHPRRQGKPQASFRRIHDIYALGVVLLEIGLWTPAMTLIGRLSESGKPEEISKRLIWHAEHNLPVKVGIKFRDVTVRCLSGVFGVEKDDEEESVLLQAFSERVVDVLSNAAANI